MSSPTSSQHFMVVSIINYRTGPLTIACAQSVLDDIGDHDIHVVIVDNASNDGSADDIADWIATLPADASVELVRSAQNTGFSGGHNLGMDAALADYYLLLNSDAVVRPGFFNALAAATQAHPKAGLIAPQIIDDEGMAQNSLFRIPTPISELIRGAQTGPVTRLFQGHQIVLDADTSPESIGWASFACIALKADMRAQIGPMDEGYFLYFEDAEYCLRARRAGWSLVPAPDAKAIHFRGGSGPVKALQAAKKRMPPYFYASRSRFLYQAHGQIGLIASNLLWYLGRAIAQMRRLAGKPVPRAAEQEARDIWINAWTPEGARRAPGE